jgi:hypothetical protein
MGCWLERQAAAQIEYLNAENRLLRSRLGRRRIVFIDAERSTRATLAKEIGTKGALSGASRDVSVVMRSVVAPSHHLGLAVHSLQKVSF